MSSTLKNKKTPINTNIQRRRRRRRSDELHFEKQKTKKHP
jgi:hypothetical protein